MTDSIIERFRRWRLTRVPLPRTYGKRFQQVFAFLQEHQRAGRDEQQEYQWNRIKALLEYANAHVPFYRRRFAEIGLEPGDIKTRDDFRKIPYLTRADVTEYIDELVSDEIERLNPVETVTSGTSRDRLRIYRSEEAETWRKAMMWRHFQNIGYHFREPRAQFTGKLTMLPAGEFSDIDYNENLLRIEQTSISYNKAPEVYRKLKEFAPKMIYCQPANIATLILHFQDHRLRPFPAPIVYLTGEIIYPQYRKAIESFFGAKIIDYYGNRENTVAAVQLSDGRMYIQTEYCNLEFINANGDEVVGAPADIVATSLVNYAMPLIRYHTDDVGINRGYPEHAVAHYPVMEIIGGRGKDLILTQRGLIYPQIEIAAGGEKFERVRVEQQTLEHLHITYVPTKKFAGADDEAFLLKVYREYFGSEFNFTIERVSDIPMGESGKNKLYVSKLAMDYLRKRQS
ncbi:MAG: hypothetical protein WBP42_01525 [Candidatus Zixiibacteriota bacterium]